MIAFLLLGVVSAALVALIAGVLPDTPAAFVPPAPEMSANARGYWETAQGKLTLDEYPGKIYYYDWYALETTPAGRAVVVWDNGLNCSRTNGRVQGNAIQFVVDGVETVFVIHDARHATVTFRWGWQTYVKQLIKTRAEPQVICM